MERTEILEKIQEIFRDIIDNDELELAENLTAYDIEGYDSLSHIQIVVSIEKEFKIKFLASEINSWQNIGEMMDCIVNKIN